MPLKTLFRIFATVYYFFPALLPEVMKVWRIGRIESSTVEYETLPIEIKNNRRSVIQAYNMLSCIDKTNRPHQKQHGGPLEAHLITDMRTHIYARIRLHIPYLANATGRP